MSTDPIISVIIPTHNRRDSVCRTLTALSRQTMDAGQFEVIVIADGCVDDTAATLRAQPYPFRLRVIEQPGQGQGKARNTGAEAAAGAILVFLDDDIEPFPGLLSAYDECHRAQADRLVLGPAYPVLREEKSMFSHGLRNWWNDHIRAITRPAHRFTYRDMHSGNFSISAALFARANGFDPEFFGRSGEDYEFGMRLLALGVPFTVAPGASAYHHDATDLARSLVRVRMEGRADVLIGVRHPELRAASPLSSFRSPRSGWIRTLRNLAFSAPLAGDLVARVLQVALEPLEIFRARTSWRKVHGAIRAYWYCRGAAEELVTSSGSTPLDRFLDEVPPGPLSLEPLELEDSLTESIGALDQRRPRGVEVRLSGIHLGMIPDIPGAEPVRGAHLSDFLEGDAAYRALMALSIKQIRHGGTRRSA
jgi:glycosyltransferase involved in cell wall biosynthesis